MPTLRKAQETDAELLSEIGFRAWTMAMGPLGLKEAVRRSVRDSFQFFASNHYLTITVAEHWGTVLGWAAREKLDDEVTDIWVDPAYQKQGVGTLLLAEMERQILAHGQTVAKIQMQATNNVALNFFRKHEYSIHWMSTAWSPKLDADVESLGLRKLLVEIEPARYGNEF